MKRPKGRVPKEIMDFPDTNTDNAILLDDPSEAACPCGAIGGEAAPHAAQGHFFMTNERYNQLMRDDDAELMPHEIKQGWHFCYDWDGLLIGPGMGEMECCTCVDIPYKDAIVRGDDGFYCFWPKESGGSFSAANLREIADWLDERNKGWGAVVDEELNRIET
jgi:hypothetical protein